MMKRIIALLLALILTVGLLPTVALAAEETANTNVVPGSIGTDGKWSQTPPTQPKVDGVKTVDKTAEKVAGTDNQYKVTLTVVLEQTAEEQKPGAAATVLVLDTSGSMAYCAECGAEPEEDCEHNYVPVPDMLSEEKTYYYKTNKNGQVRFREANHCDGVHKGRPDKRHPAGWFKTEWYEGDHNTQGDALSANDLYIHKPRASRLDAAKVAAENFLKTYSGLTFNTDGTVAANQNSRNLGRYVSVVSFAKKAKSVQSWVDVSNSDVYQKVLKNIKGLSAEGGTNLDAGLTYAEYLLNDNTVRGAVKNVIALTDGQPTYCLKKNCNDLLHLLRTKLTIGSTKYCVHGDGTECTDEIYNSTVDTATRVKNVPSKLYTVCFDAGETIDVPNNGGQISVSEYLSTKIATQPTKTGEQFAYDADNAEKLYVEFAKITQSIVSGLNTGTVKDTLPTGITSAAFDEGNVKEWKLNEAPFTKNETPNTVGGKQVTTYTYTYTYTVKIDPEKASLVEVGDENYAPLNGETTLTVKNSQGTDVNIPFPIPAGKVTMPSHTVTYTDGVDSEVVFENVEKTAAYKAAIPAYGDSNPTRTGYTFTSWKWYNATDTTYANEITPAPTTMPANNLVAVAQWTPATDTKYIVEHYLQNLTDDGYTEPETETKAGTTGATATAAAKTYTGFMFDENNASNVKSGTIAADGSLVLKLYYTRNTYKVTYNYGTPPAGASMLPTEATYKYGATVTVAAKATAPGYDFDGWKKDGNVTTSFEMPADNVTLTGTWTAKSDTAYQVKHYLQNLTDDGYTLAETETKSGTTGTQTEAVAKSYTGFTVQPFNQKTIAADGTTVVEIHYNRNTYKVTYDYGTAPAGASTLPTEATYKYGAMVTVAAEATAPGYDFDGWKKDGTVTTSFEMPAQNVTLTGTWTKLGSGVFRFGDIIKKSFTAEENSNPIPYANGEKYDFYAVVKQQSGPADIAVFSSENGVLISATFDNEHQTNGAFSFCNFDEIKFTTAGEYTFHVAETTPIVPSTVKGTVTVDPDQYLLTIVVDDELNARSYFTALPQPDGAELMPTITFENKYDEDPNADIVTLDLGNYVTKTFESRHGKSATETFEAKVQIWLEDVPIITNITNAAAEEDSIAIYAAANGEKVYDKTGTVTLSTGETKPFDFGGSITLDRNHRYRIRVTETAGSNTDVEYDKTVYETYVNFDSETKEVKWYEYNGNFSFTNTYTGIDDYYPIIIPTIINKDTGMLNKTDHFAYVIGYPDGTVHPNGQITRAEVATIFFRLLRDEVRDGAFTTSNSYSDVAYGKWYNNPISTMSALGIITGYPDGTFKPNKPITRAEFAAIAARFDETQSGKSATFSDVIGHWAAKEIGIAYYNDWIKGYPDGTFKPDQNITRAEAMTLINRVLERKPESPADLLTNMNKWTDNMDTSKWYYLDVQEATNSHGYTRKTFNYELWRQMLNDPDWSRYER